MSTAQGTMISIAMLMFLMGQAVVEGGSLGVNFGRQTSQKLLPSMVVDLCLANNIKKLKLFSTNEAVLSAFTRSNVEIYLSIANVDVLLVNTSGKAMNWVKNNLTRFINNMEVDVRYLSVTVEPFSLLETDRGDLTFIYNLANNIKYVQDGIKQYGLDGKVKVTVPHGADVLKVVQRPSEAEFRDDVKPIMIDSIKNLYANGDPFTLNIYPFHYCINESYPIEFGLWDKKHNIVIKDTNATYTNMFDFKYDAMKWALTKEGFGDMEIIVGQVGWPTDGAAGATVKNAKRFYDGLIKKIASNEGTPLHPGAEINAYIYSLADENQRNTKRGPYERHYGIYNYDGKPKFNIDFTMRRDRDVELEIAQGVTYLPHRWCVVNKTEASGRMKDMRSQFNFACAMADCTALQNGSSCADLNEMDKVSYAFNNHFQMSNQEMSPTSYACYYDGLGVVVHEDPGIGDCVFDVQILSTLFINAQSTGEMQATLGILRSGQERVRIDPGLAIVLLVFSCFYLSYRNYWKCCRKNLKV